MPSCSTNYLSYIFFNLAIIWNVTFQDDFSLSLLNELSVKYGIQTHLSHSPLPQKLEELRDYLRREIKKELKVRAVNVGNEGLEPCACGLADKCTDAIPLPIFHWGKYHQSFANWFDLFNWVVYKKQEENQLDPSKLRHISPFWVALTSIVVFWLMLKLSEAHINRDCRVIFLFLALRDALRYFFQLLSKHKPGSLALICPPFFILMSSFILDSIRMYWLDL